MVQARTKIRWMPEIVERLFIGSKSAIFVVGFFSQPLGAPHEPDQGKPLFETDELELFSQH